MQNSLYSNEILEEVNERQSNAQYERERRAENVTSPRQNWQKTHASMRPFSSIEYVGFAMFNMKESDGPRTLQAWQSWQMSLAATLLKQMEDGPLRKRGRPSGKNRVPLSAEERRARNALYERQRRAENAEAMAELAQAMGLDPSKIQGPELLNAVINYIEQDRESVDSLRSINQKLEMQIKSCEERLNPNPAPVVKEEYLPETPSPEPDVDESMAAVNYTDALTSGAVPGYSNGVKIEVSPPNTEEQTDEVELDFDFLLEYIDKKT